VALELRQRLARRTPAPVGAIRGDRLVRVGHHDDPRLERDLLARQRVRVAATVGALVVVEDPARLLGQVGRGDDVVAELAMRLHRRVLVVRQRARLLQDPVGHADLADVVQQPGEAYLGDTRRRQAELGRHQRAQLGDGLAVVARARVLRVDGAGQSGGEGMRVAPCGERVDAVTGAEVGGEDERAAAGALGRLQRQVGAAEELLGRGLRGLRDPGRRRHAGAVRERPEALLERVHEAERRQRRALVHHERELVAADAEGGAVGATERRGERADERVPGLVAGAVVDLLQAVEVEEDEAAANDVAAEMLLERPVVAEAGEVVGERCLGEPGELLPPSDVETPPRSQQRPPGGAE
jgi:hypothetical protein